jgi:hypothetical protein
MGCPMVSVTGRANLHTYQILLRHFFQIAHRTRGAKPRPVDAVLGGFMYGHESPTKFPVINGNEPVLCIRDSPGVLPSACGLPAPFG